MSNRIVLILIAIILVAGGLIGGYLVVVSKSKTSSIPSLPSITKEEVSPDLTYTDESGFSFKYPKGIKVSDVTPQDDSYYTVLSLVKGGQTLTITAKDTSAKTPDGWLGQDPTYRGATLAGATTLGGISAKEYAYGEKLLTVAVDKGVVYLIEGPKDSGFWEDTQNLITSNFIFAGSVAQTGEDNTIYEEEEVVQ
ncbi:hypothetical protein HYZ70_00010 [Candidatus Curtissbacteria bacterium]|nr:hypothetical protein [Candidatus Curtissbacteria bacterium]